MKHLITFTIGMCLLISVPVMADQAADEAAIREAQEQMRTAFNKHDAKAFAALSVEDYQNWEGTIRGRADLEKQRTEGFERQKNGQAKILDEIGIVFITPDVAIYKFRMEFTGALDADGKPQPPRKYLAARVFVKRDGKWLRAAAFTRTIEQ